MNLTQLKVFCEVMKTGSVSKTASTLGRTQPAITQSIRSLEESIGFKLFEKQGRYLIAVPEASYLLDEAISILSRVATVSSTMNSLQHAKIGSLNVASMPGPVAYLLPRFISRSIGENADIQVSITSRTSVQVYELAATQSIDFGFADAGSISKEGMQFRETIITADCLCAIPADHPLASHTSISVADLNGIPMAGLPDTHHNSRQVVETFERLSVVFNKRINSQTYLPLLQFVSAGQCLAIVDPLTAITETRINSTHGSVVFRPIRESLRYEYAVLSCRSRPMSQLASRVKNDWIEEVVRLLDEARVSPVLQAEKP